MRHVLATSGGRTERTDSVNACADFRAPTDQLHGGQVHVQAGNFRASIRRAVARNRDVIAGLDSASGCGGVINIPPVVHQLGRVVGLEAHDPMTGKTGLDVVRVAVSVHAVAVHQFPREPGVRDLPLLVHQLRKTGLCLGNDFLPERAKLRVVLIERHRDEPLLRGLACIGACLDRQGLTRLVCGLGLERVALNQTTNGGYKLSSHAFTS